MASKKDKYLESAQRFLLKGQLDKAIKDYQQVVALEPKEIRYRQKLAELLVRDNRKEEAIAQYEDIAKDYAENSYFLKAIAVYKQIQRLSPGNIAITLLVASLNHKQGLVGNAFAEYSQVVAQYEKEGDLNAAVKVLEQMLVVDGDHAATRLKHAELLFSTGAGDAAYDAFASLLTSLKTRGDGAAAKQVGERMRQLFPDRQQDDLDEVSAKIAAGDYPAAIAALKEKVKRDPRSIAAWKLLTEAERKAGNSAGLKEAFHQMMNLFPDDLSVLEGGIRFHLDNGDCRGALSLLELHLPQFIDHGASATAEAVFLSFPPDFAREPRLLDGLRRLYEAAGEFDKLGALEQQSQAAGESYSTQDPFSSPETEAPSAFEPAPAQPEAPSAFDTPAPSEVTGVSVGEAAMPDLASHWEEEIELDLDDDGGMTSEPAVSEVELPLDFSRSLELEEFPAEEPPCAFGESVEVGSPFAEAPSPFGEEAASPFEEAPSPFGEGEPPVAVAEESVFSDAFPAASPFEEAPAFGDTAAPAEAPFPVEIELPSDPFVSDDDASLTADDEGLLDLDLPDDSDFPDIEWAEDSQEAVQLDEPESAHELEPALEIEPADEIEAAQEIEAVQEIDLAHETELGHEIEQVDAHELELQLEEAQEAEQALPETEPKVTHGWQEIFPAITAEQADDLDELESHYDLGVGYKEMGMYSQAIKEFAVAAGNPQRRLDCLTLQAVCYREKGEPEKAQDLLQRGRDLDVLSDGEWVALSYELAYLYETGGSVDQAVELYREVHRHNPGFHDVAQRLSSLTGEEPLDIIDLDLEEG